jgi:hypothetical protein
MHVNFLASPNSDRVQMNMEGLCRFTTLEHVIKQAARNGKRRER